MPNDFMGLSALGLTKPSTSSKVDDASQPDLLSQMLEGSNSILDETAKSRILEQQIAQMQQPSNQGLLDQLLSPQGLAALAGTLGAGLAGGGQAAAGFGLGSLQGALARAEADRAMKRKAIDELEKRNDETQKRLDNARNRVATMFNTNPEAFVNPVTGEQTVAPDVLGFYATGIPIPTFATTRRIENRRDTAWDKQQALLLDALKGAQSQDDAKSILDAMFVHMGTKAAPGLTEALSRTYGTKEWEPAMVNTLADYAGPTFIDAAIFAGENGLPLTDPSVLRKMSFRDPSLNDKQTASDYFLKLVQEVNAWQADPANLDKMRDIRQQVGNKGVGAVALAVADEVFGGRQGDLAVYKHEAALKDPDEFAQDLFNFKLLQDKYKLGISISGLQGMDKVSQMSDTEQNQTFWGQAQQLSEDQRKLAQENQAKQDTQLAIQTANRLKTERGLSPADANAVAIEIMKRALHNATSPNGKVDRARFEQEIRKLTDEGIAGSKE